MGGSGNSWTATGDELSREELRYVRPGDSNTLIEQASYNDKDISDDDDQGELFPVDADDESYVWDEAEDGGIAPPGGQRRQDPIGTRDGGT